jgi:hypothetical protein
LSSFPSRKGNDIWQDLLNVIFLSRKEEEEEEEEERKKNKKKKKSLAQGVGVFGYILLGR